MRLTLVGFSLCLVFGATAPVAAQALRSQTVPLLTLTTDDGAAIDHKQAVEGAIEISPNGLDSAWAFRDRIEIKGRGNSTWDMPKKPFKIRLSRPASLLGMPADDEWVLLANYADKTLLRNLLGNWMGARLSLEYTPRNEVVEVTLNGKALGTYVLTEQVKAAGARVNISPERGDYLIEIDQRKESSHQFITTRGEPYAVKEPDSASKSQVRAIARDIQAIEDLMNSDDFADPVRGYASVLDVDSFIDWYLESEILKNNDASNYASIFFHKASGGKLTMGPLWDFDLAAGNVDYSDARLPEGWWVRDGSPWFARLFQDPVFAEKVRARWKQLAALGLDLKGQLAFIDQAAWALDRTQTSNFLIWDILSKYVWPNRVVMGSYGGEVGALKDWLTARMLWLDQQF